MSKSNDRWQAHLDRDRRRSQERRDAGKALRRPLPAAVDRAVDEAMKEVWRAQVLAAAGADVPAQTEASKDGVNLWRVADRALEILVERKRADKTLAGHMIKARLDPRDPDYIRVRRSDHNLRLDVTPRTRVESGTRSEDAV